MTEKEKYKRKISDLSKKKSNACCCCHCYSDNSSLSMIISTFLLFLVAVCLQAFLVILLNLFTLVLIVNCSCLLFEKMSEDQLMHDYFSQNSKFAVITFIVSSANLNEENDSAQISNEEATFEIANFASSEVSSSQNVFANLASSIMLTSQHVFISTQIIVDRYMISMSLFN